MTVYNIKIIIELRHHPSNLQESSKTLVTSWLIFQSQGAFVCSICEVGFYCAGDATARTVMLRDMICPAGMHCPPGSDKAPDLVDNACDKGHYCLKGSEVCW